MWIIGGYSNSNCLEITTYKFISLAIQNSFLLALLNVNHFISDSKDEGFLLKKLYKTKSDIDRSPFSFSNKWQLFRPFKLKAYPDDIPMWFR